MFGAIRSFARIYVCRMGEGIRAEFEIDDPGQCQVTERAPNASTGAISRSSMPVDGEVVEEFSVEDTATVEVSTPVFEDGAERWYRISRAYDQGCVCERIEGNGIPVHRVSAEGGTLIVEVLLDDVKDVNELVSTLRDGSAGVSLRRLVQGQVDGGDSDIVLPDGDRLTDKQYAALEVAHRLGYFNYPKDSNAGEVADHLNISRTSFTERLSAAQSKLFDWMLYYSDLQ